MPRVKCKATGKVRFKDELAAKLALATIDRTNADKQEVRYYECYKCARRGRPGYHLTSKASK